MLSVVNKMKTKMQIYFKMFLVIKLLETVNLYLKPWIDKTV